MNTTHCSTTPVLGHTVQGRMLPIWGLGCIPSRSGTAAPPGDLPALKVTEDTALITQAPAVDSVLEGRKMSVTATRPVQQNSGDKWNRSLLCTLSQWFGEVVKARKLRVIFSLEVAPSVKLPQILCILFSQRLQIFV